MGLLGKLRLIDDGTCKINNFVKPSINGIATYSDIPTNIYVMNRLDNDVILVLLK